MRSGVTRAQLRLEVQIEAKLSTAAGHAVRDEERINHLLNRMERQLELEHSWPTRRTEAQVTIPANTQIGSLPGGMNFTNVSEVWTAFGEDWLTVTHGIGAAERSTYGPTERVRPICRWEIQTNGTDFEVWPISAAAEVLRFSATLAAGTMANDASTCVLDGDVLVLRTAAELLAKGAPEEAQLKMAAAQRRVEKLLARQVGLKDEPANMAAGYPRRPGARPYIDFIPPRG